MTSDTHAALRPTSAFGHFLWPPRAVALALEKGEDPTDIGVHRCYLARMVDEGLLVKVAMAAIERQCLRRLESTIWKARSSVNHCAGSSRITCSSVEKGRPRWATAGGGASS